MYKDRSSSSKVVLKNRPAAVTPPLQTRSSVAGDSKPLFPAQSSTKRKKAQAKDIDPSSIVEDGNQAVAKRERTSADHAKPLSGAEDGKQTSPMGSPTKRQKTLPTDLKPLSKLEKRPLFDISKSSTVVTQADLTSLRINTLPTVCEIDEAFVRDPYLDSLGAYENLAPLLKCEVDTASGNKYGGSKPNGRFIFANWPELCQPGFSMSTAANLMLFDYDEDYVNLSRVPPVMLTGRLLPGQRTYDVCIDNKTAMCVSGLMSRKSYLLAEHPNLGNHSLGGIGHNYEWERYEGVLGLLTGQTRMGSQVYNQITPFQTRATNSYSNNQASSSNVPDCLFAHRPSATTLPVRRPRLPLEFTDIVPVYDGTAVQDDFQ
ncbi:hypothetical protein BDN70DRAFT_902347, partial [Pholiota conissans]